MVIGVILVAVGIIALLVQLDVLSGSIWSYTWPAILIIFGLWFILGRFRRRSWRWWGMRPWDDRDQDMTKRE
jgi:tellurite resistance protein TehA-like permease